MKKTLSVFLSTMAVLFLSTALYADTGFQNDFSIKQWNALCYDGSNNVFSLTANYHAALKIESIYNFGKEKTNPFMEQAVSGDVGSIKAEIARLKKKKSTSLIAAGVLGALAAFFVYEAIIYEETERTNQLDQLGGTSNRGMGRYVFIAGAGLSVVVSVMLVGGASKAGKAIKAYEKELKNSAAVKQ